ncbi:DNA starvation/stationary phase protection protein [Shewanella sp. JM162201]|uniref:DNA starvation/stationary phase protection protein n=1 Tax=Shewanella jiangmenensis TaxID=2837387 RepID=A0ABS5V2D0_9GAMM|nr:Dps family protein [Shewanella jiangmenensis]MBT1444621.1 DNA starvation/stationary phase protection protein [Shewanella jiangmenensis]
MINNGIDPKARLGIATRLYKLLADSYGLYLKTHSFHWNVTGPMFASLHLLFEQQYTELGTAVDSIAERVRTLGQKALGSYSAFAAVTDIKEDSGRLNTEAMIRALIDDQEIVIRSARALIPLASEACDEATVDLLTQRVSIHEKNAWMLRSLLEE